MVQTRDQNLRRSEYWKLDSGQSKSNQSLLEILTPKHRVYKNTGRTRLREIYSRHQRGLLSYEGVPACELQTFIIQRALAPAVDIKPTIANLKKLLELADDGAIFHRFSDLPPELRGKIYCHYFDSLHDEHSSPLALARPICGQPPITYACRQTRQEALPLFYSRCRFVLPTDSCKDNSIRLRRDALDLLHNTSADNVARIRFLAMHIDISESLFCDCSVAITININDEHCSAKISDFEFEGLLLGRKHPERFVDRVNKLLVLEHCST